MAHQDLQEGVLRQRLCRLVAGGRTGQGSLRCNAVRAPSHRRPGTAAHQQRVPLSRSQPAVHVLRSIVKGLLKRSVI